MDAVNFDDNAAESSFTIMEPIEVSLNQRGEGYHGWSRLITRPKALRRPGGNKGSSLVRTQQIPGQVFQKAPESSIVADSMQPEDAAQSSLGTLATLSSEIRKKIYGFHWMNRYPDFPFVDVGNSKPLMKDATAILRVSTALHYEASDVLHELHLANCELGIEPFDGASLSGLGRDDARAQLRVSYPKTIIGNVAIPLCVATRFPYIRRLTLDFRVGFRVVPKSAYNKTHAIPPTFLEDFFASQPHIRELSFWFRKYVSITSPQPPLALHFATIIQDEHTQYGLRLLRGALSTALSNCPLKVIVVYGSPADATNLGSEYARALEEVLSLVTAFNDGKQVGDFQDRDSNTDRRHFVLSLLPSSSRERLFVLEQRLKEEEQHRNDLHLLSRQSAPVITPVPPMVILGRRVLRFLRSHQNSVLVVVGCALVGTSLLILARGYKSVG